MWWEVNERAPGAHDREEHWELIRADGPEDAARSWVGMLEMDGEGDLEVWARPHGTDGEGAHVYLREVWHESGAWSWWEVDHLAMLRAALARCRAARRRRQVRHLRALPGLYDKTCPARRGRVGA